MADRYTSKEFRDLQGNTERFIWDNKTNKRVSKERFQQSLRIPASLYTRKRIGGRNVLVSKATGKVVSQKEQRQLMDDNREIRRAAQNKLRGDAYSSINRNIIKPVGNALSDFMKIGVWAEGGTGKETVLGRKSRLAREEQAANLEDDRKEFKPNAEANLRIQQRMAENDLKNAKEESNRIKAEQGSVPTSSLHLGGGGSEELVKQFREYNPNLNYLRRTQDQNTATQQTLAAGQTAADASTAPQAQLKIQDPGSNWVGRGTDVRMPDGGSTVLTEHSGDFKWKNLKAGDQLGVMTRNERKAYDKAAKVAQAKVVKTQMQILNPPQA